MKQMNKDLNEIERDVKRNIKIHYEILNIIKELKIKLTKRNVNKLCNRLGKISLHLQLSEYLMLEFEENESNS